MANTEHYVKHTTYKLCQSVKYVLDNLAEVRVAVRKPLRVRQVKCSTNIKTPPPFIRVYEVTIIEYYLRPVDVQAKKEA